MPNLAFSSDIITCSLNQVAIGQRIQDGYINATAICQAAGKRWKALRGQPGDSGLYRGTGNFLDAGIPASELIQTLKGGNPSRQGTWVHLILIICVHLSCCLYMTMTYGTAAAFFARHGLTFPAAELI